jgi:hypothetical protein
MIDERAAFFGMPNIPLSFQDAERGENCVVGYGRIGHRADYVGYHRGTLLPKDFHDGEFGFGERGDCFRAMGDSLKELRIALIQLYIGSV